MKSPNCKISATNFKNMKPWCRPNETRASAGIQPVPASFALCLGGLIPEKMCPGGREVSGRQITQTRLSPRGEKRGGDVGLGPAAPVFPKSPCCLQHDFSGPSANGCLVPPKCKDSTGHGGCRNELDGASACPQAHSGRQKYEKLNSSKAPLATGPV